MIQQYSLEELKICLRETAKLWKRPVNALDVSVCEDLILTYGFDTETVCYLLHFAARRGADTLNYLYPLADVLKKKGIQSKTDAELTLEKCFDRYTDILVYINQSKKVPSIAEKEKIDEIYREYAPTGEEIQSVGEITRLAKRPSLQYFEAVLRNRRELKKSAGTGKSAVAPAGGRETGRSGRYGESGSEPVVMAALRKYSPEEPDSGREQKGSGLISAPEAFERIKQSVKQEAGLSDLAYNTWIRDLKAVSCRENRIEIRIPGSDDRFLHLIETKYKGYLEQACITQGLAGEIQLKMERNCHGNY